MSTISEKLTQLNTIKGDIKTAINNKGGEVGNNFSTYATAINNLSTGSGGSGETYENPEFYELRTQNGTNYDNLFRGYNGPDIDVSQWDTSKVTSAQHCFDDCKKSMDISNWDLGSLADASYMFGNCPSTITGLENMNFSNVTNATNMFYSFKNGNKYIDLSVLDFSNVTNVYHMFDDSNTDYIDVRNIKLPILTNYSYMFNSCKGTELDLSNWNISKVTNIYYMFAFSSFKKINLSGWKTTNVTNMGTLFYYVQSLETLLISDWDMTNATSTSSFLGSVPKLKYIDLSRSNDLTIKKIAPMLPTKTATTYGEILVPANTSQDAIDALTAKYWKPIGPKFDLNSTELVLELDEIKPGKTTKICNGNSDPWYGDDRLETIEFISSDESIATVNGREITGVAEGTVTIECRRREDNVVVGSTTLTISKTDSNPNLIKFRIDENTLTNYYSAITVNGTALKPNNLTKDPITGIYSYDPGAHITSIKFGSYGYNRLKEIIKFNFSDNNITSLYETFQYYAGETIDLSDWDTSNVTKFDSIFTDSSNIVEVIGKLDLSSAKGMYASFNRCTSLETIYLKNIYKNSPVAGGNTYEINLGDTKVKDECLLYIINELPNLYDKGVSSGLYFTLPKNNTLTAEQVQPAIDKGWTVVNVNY